MCVCVYIYICVYVCVRACMCARVWNVLPVGHVTVLVSDVIFLKYVLYITMQLPTASPRTVSSVWRYKYSFA